MFNNYKEHHINSMQCLISFRAKPLTISLYNTMLTYKYSNHLCFCYKEFMKQMEISDYEEYSESFHFLLDRDLIELQESNYTVSNISDMDESAYAIKTHIDKIKDKARACSSKLKYPEGINGKKYQKHHWAYCKQYWDDVIFLPTNLHGYVHSLLYFDEFTLMYRIKLTDELLDTRSKHIDFVMEVMTERHDRYNAVIDNQIKDTEDER